MNNIDGRTDLLLVEDSPTDAELCIRTLRENGLANEIVLVTDGAEALDFLFGRSNYAARGLDHPPKLVLLDLRLPKIDGLEVLRQIRASEQLKTLPVVIFTSSQEQRDVAESYGRGANGFVSKPVEFQEFANAVKHLGLYWLIVNKPPF